MSVEIGNGNRTIKISAVDLTTAGKRSRMDFDPQVYIGFQYLLAGSLGSLGGVAALLKGEDQLTGRSFWAGLLGGFLLGVGICALVFHFYGPQHSPLSIMLSAFAGLGGWTFIDFTVGLLKTIAKKWSNGK
jgi:hypothetical protein